MADTDRPLLNPVLSLHVEPKREAATTGGKSRKDIVTGRLAQQRRVLSRELSTIYERRERLPVFGGRVQLVAHMFDDSIAATKTPSSLFSSGTGARLVAPMRQAYLIEAELGALPALARFVQTDATVAGQVDISRVEHVHAFGPEDVLRGRDADALWEQAPDYENGKGFLLSFAPFRDGSARENLMQQLIRYAEDEVLISTSPTVSLPRSSDEEEFVALPVRAASQSSLMIGLRRYRNTGRARTVVQIASKEALSQIIASGTVFRIDPVPQIGVTAPGEGSHPGPLPPDLSGQPIVGVVDGGRTAASYEDAEVWRAPPLVRDSDADHKHGNRVTALAVHGHAWNTNLPLPELFCRIGTAQAVPRSNSGHRHDPQQLISYLERVMGLHRNTRVWNMSFNEMAPCDPDQVSLLGHEISRLARMYDVLPVISAGNKIQGGNEERIAPPADCEAGLVVGGRKFDGDGAPGDPCDVTLPGPGPEGMLKPDLSWYSTLRVLGGDVLTASSWVTPLLSSLAAHTFDNLKEPTSDLVRALLINHTDLEQYETVRGWGSPESDHMPWHCRPGTVTLAWRSELRPGLAYYWDDIPIPPSLVKDGRLCGKGMLTAILNPHPFLSPESDANYFSARVNVALQYWGRPTGGKAPPVKSLLGTLKTDEIAEADARAEYFKWHPVRRHSNDFSGRGYTFSGNKMRLHARVYMRDLYQFGLSRNDEVEPMEVAFVLSLSDGTESSNLYNEMRASLGAYVESAVLDQEIDVET